MQKLLKETFTYKDGELLVKRPMSWRQKIGKPAGTPHNMGYTSIGIKGKVYLAHRLVWIYHNGDIPNNLQVDHINRNRKDNRIENLRIVTAAENEWNKHIPQGYVKCGDKFKAFIAVNHKKFTIGTYSTAEEAKKAYFDIKDRIHVYNDIPNHEEVQNLINDNRPLLASNTSGYKGVNQDRNGRWMARFTIDGKRIKVPGMYDTALEANNALAKFKKENNYE